MYKLTPILLAFLILAGCNSSKNSTNNPENTITNREKDNGWQSLFDGKTTNGWHTYGKETVGNVWKVKDGILHLDPETKNPERGDLVTNEEYSNFDLKLDWKIEDKGNSGIIFYIHEDPAKYHETYNTGLEMQILDNGTPTRAGHPDGKIYTHRAGDLYDLIASKEAVNPQGEWNHIEIKSQNGKLDFYMNGRHTLSTSLWDDNWQKMVAISKFKSMPDFGTFKNGKIALQYHGGSVWFKDIRIKRL